MAAWGAGGRGSIRALGLRALRTADGMGSTRMCGDVVLRVFTLPRIVLLSWRIFALVALCFTVTITTELLLSASSIIASLVALSVLVFWNREAVDILFLQHQTPTT